MARSAVSNQQKIQILSNELTRRMSNVKIEDVGQEDKNKIVEEFTQELKCSGYTFTMAKTITQSGLKGWMTRRRNREKNGQEFYRTAKASAYSRERKKLLGKETWYKNCPETDDESPRKFRKTNNCTRIPTDDKNNKNKNTNSKDEKISYNKTIKSVMFVPFTRNSELAKRLRNNEENLFNLTRTRVKVVERAGIKIQDLLTTSNPWKGADCGRQYCLICLTKLLTEKNLRQECTRRNLVYETKCLTCEQEEISKLENELEDKSQIKEALKNIKKHIYIGETNRSAYERGWEHCNDLAKLSNSSHMLRHLVSEHEHQDFSEIKFGMRVIKFTKTSFERQILEAVVIEQENKKNNILNSRTEYNRSSLPRLTTKLGDSEHQNWQKEITKDKKRNAVIDDKIRALRKERNKARLLPSKEAPPAKKRKTEDGISIRQVWGKPETKKSEKMTRTEYEDNSEQQENNNKKKLLKRDKNTGIEITVEGVVSAPEKNWDQYEKLDWEKEIERHRLKLEKKAEEDYFNEKLRDSDDPSWELMRLCTDYLEENSDSWAKRKRINEQEKNRQERRALARHKQV